MRHVIAFLRHTVIGGLIFWIPLFAIVLILKKLYATLTGPANRFADLLNLNVGKLTTPIVVSIFLIVVFFLSGLILRIGFLSKSRNWIDRQLGIYIPGYDFYKQNLVKRIDPASAGEGRPAVLINLDGTGRLGFLVETLPDGRLVTFIPTKPDAPDGAIIVVQAENIRKLPGGERRLESVLKAQGKGTSAWLNEPPIA